MFKASLSLRCHNQNPLCISPVSHTRHITCQSHSYSFYHRNNMWRRMQVVKLLKASCPLPSYLSSSAPHSPTPSAFVFSSVWETKFHNHTNNRQNCSSVTPQTHIWWFFVCVIIKRQTEMRKIVNTGCRPRGLYTDRVTLYYKSMTVPLWRNWSRIGTFTFKTMLLYPSLISHRRYFDRNK